MSCRRFGFGFVLAFVLACSFGIAVADEGDGNGHAVTAEVDRAIVRAGVVVDLIADLRRSGIDIELAVVAVGVDQAVVAETPVFARAVAIAA